ncbi:MAG: presenilin family intramembrane aspartyl protease [Candidatus Nanoarchaeia archaeon]|nr:presenilin family intramembrane aspartyl protease [Candidatus Nanoarchaeia archaeon]
MKHTKKITVLLVLIFLIHQLFGIFVISNIVTDLSTEYSDEQLSSEVIFFPFFLIFASLIFIILSRFKKIIKYWYILAMVLCGYITLSALIEPYQAIILSILIILVKKLTDDDYFNNLSELIIYPSIAIILLPVINLLSAIILLILISVYDFLAVYFSKHMVLLAKTQIKNTIFSGIKIRYGKESAIIGGGDIAFVMILVSVIFRDYGLFNSVVTALSSSIGLLTLLLLAQKKKFYPAMPFLTISSIIGFFFSILLTSSL